MNDYSHRVTSELLPVGRLIPPHADALLMGVSMAPDGVALGVWSVPREDERRSDLESPFVGIAASYRDDGMVAVAEQTWPLGNGGEIARAWLLPDNRAFTIAPSVEVALGADGELSTPMFGTVAAIVDPNGLSGVPKRLDLDIAEVRTSATGRVWIAREAAFDPQRDRMAAGIDRFDSDFNLEWSSDDIEFSASCLTVVGEGVVFYDRWEEQVYSTTSKQWLDPEIGEPDWMLHDPVKHRWGFVRVISAKFLIVVLGWQTDDGAWKPFSMGQIDLPFASPLEQTIIDCDADSINVWIDRRWYSVSLDSLFDDSERARPPHLPAVDEGSLASMGVAPTIHRSWSE